MANLGLSWGIPDQGWLYQVLNNPDGDDGAWPSHGICKQSGRTGRRENDKFLLSCCFGVAKKHMEVFMELLEHRGGSVLTPPRQRAFLCLSIHCLWVGRAWGGAGHALVSLHSAAVTSRGCGSCTLDIRAVCPQSWAAGTAGLPGCRLGLSCGTGGELPALPLGARDSDYWTPSPPHPTFSTPGSFPNTIPHLGAVGTPKSLPAHFPIERCWPGLPSALCRSSCAPRLESLFIFLFEVTSQLAQGLGYLCSG